MSCCQSSGRNDLGDKRRSHGAEQGAVVELKRDFAADGQPAPGKFRVRQTAVGLQFMHDLAIYAIKCHDLILY